MRRFLILPTALAATAVALSAASVASSTSAQALSPGCEELNNPGLDSGYRITTFDGPLAAGEVITISAEPPDPATTVTLEVGSVVVDTAPFPGTVEYVVPATG